MLDGTTPSTDPRGIDHIVLAVHDLEAARTSFAAMGFTLTPPSLHPFGTGNSLAQLQGSFIELLAVVEPDKLVPMSDAAFSFGIHNQRFLARRQGMSMAVLTSDDAAADNTAWAARGLRTYEPVHFARQARQPDGGTAEVAFTIAFAIDPAMPEAAFFVCQQHRPENFWQAQYQRHPNGARTIVGVTLAAERPADHAGFFETMVGPDAVRATDGGLEITLAGGRFEVLSPTALAERFASAAPMTDSPAFVATTVSVADLESAARCLSDAGIDIVERAGAIEVPPDACFGMLLELVSEP